MEGSQWWWRRNNIYKLWYKSSLYCRWFGLGLWCLMPLSTVFQLYMHIITINKKRCIILLSTDVTCQYCQVTKYKCKGWSTCQLHVTMYYKFRLLPSTGDIHKKILSVNECFWFFWHYGKLFMRFLWSHLFLGFAGFIFN
jgi:hypothetical protein